MNVVFQIFFLQCLIFFGYPFDCPGGSDQIPREDICMFAVNEPKFYLDASRYCASVGGISAKIQNAYENFYVLTMIPQIPGGMAPYIGVKRKANKTWMYADGKPLTYVNWALNEPNMSSNTSLCAIVDPQTGKWLTAECSYARPFFCSIDGDAFQCPSGWKYNNKTDACYYVSNFVYTDGVHWLLYNFPSAEGNCNRFGAHLASIHSKAEDDFVYELITRNVVNMTIAAPNSNPCGYSRAWIGYHGTGQLRTGTWTDGSVVDYFGDNPIKDSNYWRMVNDPSCHIHQWTSGASTDTYARFVCKKAAKKA